MSEETEEYYVDRVQTEDEKSAIEALRLKLLAEVEDQFEEEGAFDLLPTLSFDAREKEEFSSIDLVPFIVNRKEEE